MKILKFLGVLLVSLIFPVLVDADTAIINDIGGLESCLKTTDVCQISKDMVVESAEFDSGTILIPEGTTLTIKGDVKVSGTATMYVDGYIVVEGVLDASKMQYTSVDSENAVGLIGNRTGKISVKENGKFISLDFFELVFSGGWSPVKGEHIIGTCDEGAKIVSGNRTYVMTDGAWEGAIKVGSKYYTDLFTAVKEAPYGVATIIEVLESISTSGFIAESGKNIIIDLKGNEVQMTKPLVGSTGTETLNIQLLKGSNVKLKNGTIKAAPEAKRLIQNYSNLTLEDITLDGTTMAETVVYANSFNNGIVKIFGNTNIYAHQYAFDVYYWTVNQGKPTSYLEGTKVTVDTTGTIKGDIEVAADAMPSKSTLDIKNINHEGDLIVTDKDLQKNVNITGGKYTTNVSDLLDTEVYKVLLENGKYVVYNGYHVLQGVIENGKLSVDKEFAAVGETVTLTITPNEGYELDSVKVIDFNNKEIKVENNKFIMPNSEVWVYVEFKPIQEVETPVVDEENPVGVSDGEKTESILLENLYKNDKYKDMSVKVEIVVEDIKVSEKETKEFTKALEEDKIKEGKIVSFFDITIAVKELKSQKVVGSLSELTEKIEFKVTAPKLDEVKEGYVRSYYVIKKHGDKVEIIPATISKDGKYITFETDEFSTYALAYEDKKTETKPEKEETKIDETNKEETKTEIKTESTETITETKPENVDVPQTSDGIVTNFVLVSITFICIVGISFYLKKEIDKKQKN